MKNGVIHIQKRKMMSAELEPYPHPKKWVNRLDKLLMAVAVIGPMMTLPQLFKIFVEKNTSGISVLTWSLYTLVAIPWVVYGIIHKKTPIIISNILWVIFQLIIVTGTLIYK